MTRHENDIAMSYRAMDSYEDRHELQCAMPSPPETEMDGAWEIQWIRTHPHEFAEVMGELSISRRSAALEALRDRMAGKWAEFSEARR